MAETRFGTAHPLAPKVWSKKLAVEAITETFFSRFMPMEELSTSKGKKVFLPKYDDTTGIVCLHDDLRKQAGDRITYGLRAQLTGEGVSTDEVLEGNEEALEFFDDSLYIEELANAVKLGTRMNQQRLVYNQQKNSYDALKDWLANRFDTSAFNQLCGYTAEANQKYTGFNAAVAPSAARKIFAGATKTDEGQGSDDLFTLDMIDDAVEKAKTVSIEAGTGPKIRPVRYQGSDVYVAVVHPFQATNLRKQSSEKWYGLHKELLGGPANKDSGIFRGALGMYNNTIIFENDRITQGVHSTSGAAVSTTRRALFLGAQALSMAFGRDGDESAVKWNEESFDHGRRWSVSASTIWGCKKCKFNDSANNADEDFGVITMSSRAEASS